MDFSSTELNTNWRKVAAAIYRKPLDSKIFGSVEVDVTAMEKFISEKRKQGTKTTLTQVFTLIVGRALRQEVPELNAFVKRGKIVQRPQIDAMVSVLLKEGYMGSVKIENTDQLNLTELAEKIRTQINQSRKGKENETMQSKNTIASLPWPLRSWVFFLYRKVTIEWGITLPFLGVTANSFGSYVISNIATLGLESGFGALLPSSNVAMVMVLGGAIKKPVIINDQIVVRKMMSITVTLDHRVVDASHGGKLFRFIKHMIKHPELLEEKKYDTF